MTFKMKTEMLAKMEISLVKIPKKPTTQFNYIFMSSIRKTES